MQESCLLTTAWTSASFSSYPGIRRGRVRERRRGQFSSESPGAQNEPQVAQHHGAGKEHAINAVQHASVPRKQVG